MTRIRLATHEDLQVLSLRDHVAENELTSIVVRGRILVAERASDGRIIGWLRWGLFWDQVPFMNLLYVDEPHRGEGVGQLLVSSWEHDCRQDGHNTVMTSIVSAESAQHFYRKLGYTDAGCLLLPGESAEIFFIKGIAET